MRFLITLAFEFKTLLLVQCYKRLEIEDNPSFIYLSLITLSSRWKRTRAVIDEIMLREDILSCDALNHYYGPMFENNKNNTTFLEGMITAYTTSGCDQSDIFAKTSEEFYRMETGPESARDLAILFITRNELKKAAV